MTRYLKFLAAAVPMLAAGFAYGEITGSKHDFSAQAWSDNQICKPCHTPHNADVSLTGRIWAHTMSTATYKYHGGTASGFQDKSTSQDGATATKTQADLDNATRLCLSCHDGTVALDSFRGKNGGPTGKSISDFKDDTKLYNPNIGGANVGDSSADLSNDHPVGYSAHVDETKGSGTEYYYKPIAGIAAALKLATSPDPFPAGKTNQSGQPITYTNYYSVSCVTCHDVHNGKDADGGKGLLRMSNQGSALCLTCHNK